MLVAQISDTHIATADDGKPARIDDLARTVAAIRALPRQPDAIIHTGDVAHDGSTSDYGAARAVMAGLGQPVFATVGNRDRRPEFMQAFAADGYLSADARFTQYAVDIGPIRLVAVDTQHGASPLGGFCPERRRHLDSILAGRDTKPVLVFAHHPPVAVTGLDAKERPLQFFDESEADLLTGWIAQTPNVLGVIAGHIHRARAAMIGAVPLRTIPSIAADLSWEKEDGSRTYLRRPVIHLHEISGNTLKTTRVVV